MFVRAQVIGFKLDRLARCRMHGPSPTADETRGEARDRIDNPRSDRPDGQDVLQHPRYLCRIRERPYPAAEPRVNGGRSGRREAEGQEAQAVASAEQRAAPDVGTGDYSISDLGNLFQVSRPTIYRTLTRQPATE